MCASTMADTQMLLDVGEASPARQGSSVCGYHMLLPQFSLPFVIPRVSVWPGIKLECKMPEPASFGTCSESGTRYSPRGGLGVCRV